MKLALACITLALVSLTFSAPAWAGPVEVVQEAFGTVVNVVQTGNQAQQINTLCRLVDRYVDVDQVTTTLLSKAAVAADNRATQNLKDLIPAVIVTELMKVVPYFDGGISVDSRLVPRGSKAKGVRMSIVARQINNSEIKFIVVLIPRSANWKIVNLEVTSYAKNLVETKKMEFGKIMGEDPAHPVSYLVDTLRKDRDLIHCR